MTKIHLQHPLEKWEKLYLELKSDRHPDESESDTERAYKVLIDFAREYGFERAPMRAINYSIDTVRLQGSNYELEAVVVAAMREMGYVDTFIEFASNYVEGE